MTRAFRKLLFGSTDTETHIHVRTHFHIKQNIKMSSFKSSENIQKKEGGPDRSVPDNQSLNLNELAMKARKPYRKFKLQQRSHTMTDI